MVYPLCQLKAGETACITWILCGEAMEKQLNALGFSFGCPVTCVLRSGGGRLCAYKVGGRVIGLRAAATREILVRSESNTQCSAGGTADAAPFASSYSWSFVRCRRSST